VKYTANCDFSKDSCGYTHDDCSFGRRTRDNDTDGSQSSPLLDPDTKTCSLINDLNMTALQAADFDTAPNDDRRRSASQLAPHRVARTAPAGRASIFQLTTSDSV